jgi:hypothetical protein
VFSRAQYSGRCDSLVVDSSAAMSRAADPESCRPQGSGLTEASNIRLIVHSGWRCARAT